MRAAASLIRHLGLFYIFFLPLFSVLIFFGVKTGRQGGQGMHRSVAGAIARVADSHELVHESEHHHLYCFFLLFIYSFHLSTVHQTSVNRY